MSSAPDSSLPSDFLWGFATARYAGSSLAFYEVYANTPHR